MHLPLNLFRTIYFFSGAYLPIPGPSDKNCFLHSIKASFTNSYDAYRNLCEHFRCIISIFRHPHSKLFAFSRFFQAKNDRATAARVFEYICPDKATALRFGTFKVLLIGSKIPIKYLWLSFLVRKVYG